MGRKTKWPERTAFLVWLTRAPDEVRGEPRGGPGLSDATAVRVASTIGGLYAAPRMAAVLAGEAAAEVEAAVQRLAGTMEPGPRVNLLAAWRYYRFWRAWDAWPPRAMPAAAPAPAAAPTAAPTLPQEPPAPHQPADAAAPAPDATGAGPRDLAQAIRALCAPGSGIGPTLLCRSTWAAVIAAPAASGGGVKIYRLRWMDGTLSTPLTPEQVDALVVLHRHAGGPSGGALATTPLVALDLAAVRQILAGR